MHSEKTVSKKILFEGKIITLQLCEVELENGKIATREVVRHPGGVAVLALDGAGNALFVRQFRYPYEEVLLELPAGKLEPGEDPAECGRRELEEETGHRANRFEKLGEIYPSPGYVAEVLHLYLAQDLVPTRQNLDADEFLTVEKTPFDQALRRCLDGEIKDAKTVASVYKYALMQQ